MSFLSLYYFSGILFSKCENWAVVAQEHKGVTVTRGLWVRFPLEEIKYLFKFIFPFLRSGDEAKERR